MQAIDSSQRGVRTAMDARHDGSPARERLITSARGRSAVRWIWILGLLGAGCARPAASAPSVHPAQVQAARAQAAEDDSRVADALASGPRLVLATRFTAGLSIHAAQPSATAYTPAPTPVAYRQKSYRLQMLVADAPGLLFPPLWIVSGAVIHLINEQPWSAFGSVGLRVGGGVAGLFIGAYMADSNDTDSEDLGTVLLSTAAGFVTGMVLDYVLLGTKCVPVYGHTLYLRPSLNVGREHATAGVMLRF